MIWSLRSVFLFVTILCCGGGQLFKMAGSAVDSSIAKVGLGPNEVQMVGIMAVRDDNPTAVVAEIAFAYGDASMAVLSATDANTWFNEREGFCRSYSNQLDVIRVEVPMGYSALLSELPKKHLLAQSIFVFVRDIGKADITLVATPWAYVVDGALSVLTAPPGADSSGNTIVAVKGAKSLC